MTIFINAPAAGDSIRPGNSGRASAVAVWEPSGYLEGSAAERDVRTLRPLDRTQGRVSAAPSPGKTLAREECAHRRRDVWATYFVGALFGGALVSASILGDAAEQPPRDAPSSAVTTSTVR